MAGSPALTFENDADAATTAVLGLDTATADPMVSASYDVVRDAVFTIENDTGASSHSYENGQLTARRGVRVTVAASDPASLGSGCSATAANSPFALTAEAAATTVDLDQANCEWVVKYHNNASATAADCKVEVELIGADGMAHHQLHRHL